MMQKLLFTLLSIITFRAASSQELYKAIPDDQHKDSKFLKGIISKQLIKNDSAYKWYAESQKAYTQPDSTITNALRKNKGVVKYIIFGGTWCDDSQFILPKFFLLQERAGIADDDITFFGVDRQKQTSANISSAFNITNVPTIIVMRQGKEVGRVVEYGKTGKWDRELADILNQ